MICSKCKEDKSKEDFYIRKESGKLRRQCKNCMKKAWKKYRTENVEAIRVRDDEYRRTINGRFSSFKTLAKAKDIKQALTKDEFEKIQNDLCNYCGDNFDRGTGYGIDRIDSNIGYILNNCVACCSKCNFAKNELNYDDFVKHVFKMAKHLEQITNTKET